MLPVYQSNRRKAEPLEANVKPSVLSLRTITQDGGDYQHF